MYRLLILLISQIVLVNTGCGPNTETVNRLNPPILENRSSTNRIHEPNGEIMGTEYMLGEQGLGASRRSNPQILPTIELNGETRGAVYVSGEHSFVPPFEGNPSFSPAFVENVLPSENAEYREVINRFAQEIALCGLQAKKSNCLISPLRVLDSTTAELSTGLLTFSLLTYSDSGPHFGLIVEADGQIPFASIKAARVVAVGQQVLRAEVVKNDYFVQRARTMLTISLVKDNVAHATQTIAQNGLDYRRYYHAINYLMLHAANYRSEIVAAIKKHYPLLAIATGLEVTSYQIALLNAMRLALSDERELQRLVAQRFLNLSDVKVQQFAAIILSLLEENSEKIHRNVVAALADQSGWRELSLVALNKIRTSVDDENRIIAYVSDPDDEVQALVLNIIKDWTLSDGHVVALEKLASHSSYKIREVVVKLTKQIGTPRAVALLVRLLGDRDSDVRNASLAALEERSLTPQDLPPLATLLRTSRQWETRRAAVNLIATIPGDQAAPLLIPSLKDTDSDVRAAVETALSTCTLSNAALPLLQPLLKSTQWQTRRQAVLFLAKIGTAEAAHAMVPSLADSDADVRKSALDSLMSLPTADTMVEALARVATSTRYEARMNAAQMLARIKVQTATAVLLTLVIDRDGDVRRVAQAAIIDHPFTEQQIDGLEISLNASSYSAKEQLRRLVFRAHVVQYLC